MTTSHGQIAALPTPDKHYISLKTHLQARRPAVMLSWGVTERLRWPVQAGDMSFLRRVPGLLLPPYRDSLLVSIVS